MQSTSKEAFAAEGTLQRQLAKKLGIKGKKRKAAPLPEKDAVEELDTMFAGPCCPGWRICTIGVILALQGSSVLLPQMSLYCVGIHTCRLSDEHQAAQKSFPEAANLLHDSSSNTPQYHQHLTLAGALLQRTASHLLLLTRTRQMVPLRKHPQKTAGRSWKGSSPPLTAWSRRTLKMAVTVHPMMTTVRAQPWRALVRLARP